MTITHNDLKKGEEVIMTAIPQISSFPRRAIMADGRKGITRDVTVIAENGYSGDTGSTYVDAIVYVVRDGQRVHVELSKSHREAMGRIRQLAHHLS